MVSLPRRRVLSLGMGAALALISAPVLAIRGERRLAFNNLHTGESLHTVYWQDGRYVAEGLAAINHLLRDHRSGEAGNMEPLLFDLLYQLQQRVGLARPYEVISGYRSPQTNAQLRQNSNGVAKNSLHMEGRAIDVRLPGEALRHLLHAARDLRAGGVGYYPRSGFIHLDTGPFRTWGG
ncbi:MAG: YcbK family protein [Pseudomonadota bacterium]